MTARMDSVVSVHRFSDATIGYHDSDKYPGYASLQFPGGVIQLFGEGHADIAATLVRLAGEALDHLDDEGRAVVSAAVREAFGAVLDRERAEVRPRFCAYCWKPLRDHGAACRSRWAYHDPMGSSAEVGRG